MKNFRKTALASLLVAAFPFATAVQADGFDGFVSGALGGASTDWKYSYAGYYDGVLDYSGGGKGDFGSTVGQFRATAGYTDKSGFGGQMDYVYTHANNDSDTYDAATTDIAGHAFYRMNDWLIGGFGQRTTFDYDGGEGGWSHAPATHTIWGIEAQKQLGSNMSVYAQLGKQEYRVYGYTPDGWIGAVEARYFIHDNFMVKGKVAVGSMNETYSGCCDFTEKDKFDTTGIEIGGEYRLPNSMFSFFGTYNYLDSKFKYDEVTDGPWSYTGKDSAKSHMLMVGVKLNLGKDSLRKRDLEGASLNPLSVATSFSD